MIDSYFLFASSVAALVARFVTYPIDTIKTRLQTNYESLSDNTEPRNTYANIISLYHGLSVTLLFSVPALTLYLTTYSSSKEFLDSYRAPILAQDALLNHAISGLFAEAAAGLFFTPMEVIKSQLQIQVVHQSTLSLVKGIAKEEGIFGFYRGYWITLAVFVPHSVTYFVVYEQLKAFWSEESQTFFVFLLCAAIASAAGILISTPLDIVKTRWQVSNQAEAYKGGPVSIAIRMWKYEGGAVAFTSGMWARVMWGIPLTTINMAIFEWLLSVR
ncbi:mitochondrial carrier [Rhizopus microsporus var. microsporus]|uniref:Mitochondrial carrier n=1 Tax=Rhizopus microsporus var. microsporus TaxID=86635 RepID=A0A1X0RG80_RHIZD|nr:mitochondrial carrier [Rhizopus microsporus var. microsporus]